MRQKPLTAPFWTITSNMGETHGTYQTEAQAKAAAGAKLARIMAAGYTTGDDNVPFTLYITKTVAKIVDGTPPPKFEPIK